MLHRVCHADRAMRAIGTIGTTPPRRAWLLAVDSIDDAARLAPPAPRFTVLLAAEPSEGLTPAAGALIDLGAAFFVCVGPQSRAVEDLIDHAAIERERFRDDVICTTSHPHDALDDAVSFFVSCAFPDPTDTALIAIVVGNDVLAKAIERELARYCR